MVLAGVFRGHGIELLAGPGVPDFQVVDVFEGGAGLGRRVAAGQSGGAAEAVAEIAGAFVAVADDLERPLGLMLDLEAEGFAVFFVVDESGQHRGQIRNSADRIGPDVEYDVHHVAFGNEGALGVVDGAEGVALADPPAVEPGAIG